MLLGHVSLYIVNQMLKSSSGASGCRWGRKASNTLVRYLGAALTKLSRTPTLLAVMYSGLVCDAKSTFMTVHANCYYT